MTDGRLTNGSAKHAAPLIGRHALSWTDDLPVCHLSGLGFSTNQIYREDGNRLEEHEFEDKSFHFRPFEGCFLYGVFDGHNGSKVANFAAQRMPAELLFEQLHEKKTDDEIKEVLHQAFMAVEKGYFESLDDLLAQKTDLQLSLPEGIKAYDAARQYPDVVQNLNRIDAEMSGGTTATVILIYNDRLFVANVGNTRALLCISDQNNLLRVLQLSVDHTLANETEQFRLANLGLDVEKLKQLRKIGNSDNTRCIGDYSVKGGYKDIETLSGAKSEPVIAIPHVTGGIELEPSCCFLIIMSDGLYQALQDATGTDKVNADIVAMVVQEFSVQTTLNGVAQAVVDKVVRIHHDTYMTQQGHKKQLCQKRDDITLLVRNFNYPLSNLSSPTGGARYPVPTPVPFFNPRPMPPSLLISTGPASPVSPYSNTNSSVSSSGDTPVTPTNNPPGHYLSTENTNTRTNSTNSTESSGESRPFHHGYGDTPKLELDEDGKIEPYVDFSDFYTALAELTVAQQESLSAEMKPKSVYDPLIEESESLEAGSKD
ncbi:TGF-beta-activated kinase 1 and MAP3K7-binding protein 1-like isoform X2 [Gigantopelta aegis]|uniref:TGF-beta-activated kinase 1 and MAP3K7-binding protein 1-like isoform X2 n=1 Tax=Gigantopelta aegis TaxID=1735272 RepID=UPI001B88A945|nr:TGF-beta-activated kinase 1 and MAP3K7-binding protein 1-like isoform X2 [Gigantopelta aegis]